MLTVWRAAPNAIRFTNGQRTTTASRAQLTTVLRRFETFARWKIDGVGVDESDVRALLAAMDEAAELNQ